MKKWIFIAGLLISLIQLSHGQIKTGLSGSFAYSLEDDIFDYGVGLSLQAGYLIKSRAEVILQVENLWMDNKATTGYRVKYAALNLRYYLLQNFVRPYFGFGTGYGERSFDSPLDFPRYKEESWLIKPAAGVSFASEKLMDLHYDLNLSYDGYFTEPSMKLLNFSVGLAYYFQGRN